MLTIQESINRTVNLVGVAIVGLAGFAFLPEVIFENDVPDKVDDALLFIIGIAAIWWYRRAKNSVMRSAMPVVFVALALLTKIGAIMVEFDDAESVGDDFGALILFVLSLGLVWWLYKKAAQPASPAAQ